MVHGYGIRQTAYQLLKSSGAFVSGRDFIQRNVPPGYRDPALKLFRAFEQAAGGAGLYQIINEFNSQGNQAINDGSIQQTSNKFSQARDRRGRRSSYERKYPRKYCKCRRSKRSNSKRFRSSPNRMYY